MARNLTQPDAHIPPDLIGLTQSVTPEQFERLCQEYRDLRLELTSTGELIVMPGTGFQTGRRNSNLTYQLTAWTIKDDSGVCCDSSTIFALPNGARRSPDASWVEREKLDSLSERQKEGFAPICPEFVVELRSPSDSLPTLHSKMLEYIANGASLGWLIDPFKRRVYVYRPDEELVTLENPEVVSGDPLLPGFKLKMDELW
ncbi:MAG TPA: Uma2 family endonuclease [Pyrinomonadaceae bacterium]|nr:Uma2 family endonuclease [Pyrinomonadaceae bacterium]